VWLGRREDAGESFVVVVGGKNFQLKRLKIHQTTQQDPVPPAASFLGLLARPRFSAAGGGPSVQL
jgi:hypothetical protein